MPLDRTDSLKISPEPWESIKIQPAKIRQRFVEHGLEAALSRKKQDYPSRAPKFDSAAEAHLTPKHGSWLNMAEIVLSALSGHGLNQRVPGMVTLSQVTTAWTINRNERQKGVDWQFTTADARIKLERLYPHVQSG
jgi:hypothetical protein